LDEDIEDSFDDNMEGGLMDGESYSVFEMEPGTGAGFLNRNSLSVIIVSK
jgi:hypothetical protein